jgi:hydroxymethylbilane synthase
VTIRIATRGSHLALWQARHVQSRLGAPSELGIIHTEGDRVQHVALQGQTDQGFFTKEIERAILAGEADLAVHSLKDLPTLVAPGLALAAIPERETVEDVLLVHPDAHDPAAARLPLRPGSVVGATSLRRQALLRQARPDLQPTMLRGNVPTRIQRLQRGDFGAILLARSGLRRLEVPIQGFHAYALPPALWIPAPGQAALGLECAAGSEAGEVVRRALDHAPTREAVTVERALMARFEAGCHAPFAAWAVAAGDAAWEVRLGCATETGRWVAARVIAPADEVVDAAMLALQAAQAAPEGPDPLAELACQPLASF